jgi:hypothetical protein
MLTLLIGQPLAFMRSVWPSCDLNAGLINIHGTFLLGGSANRELYASWDTRRLLSPIGDPRCLPIKAHICEKGKFLGIPLSGPYGKHPVRRRLPAEGYCHERTRNPRGLSSIEGLFGG